MAEEDAAAPESKRTGRRTKKAVPEEASAPPQALPSSADVRKAKKADLIAWAKTLGLETVGKVDELRSRILSELGKRKGEEKKPVTRKPPAAAERKPRKKTEEAEEEEEEKAHVARSKPERIGELRAVLRIRQEMAAKRTRFLRQEWFRHKRLGSIWRKPQGGQSKLRRHLRYRPPVPSIGYRGPRAARGLHPSGFAEVIVHTLRDLTRIDSKSQAVRIAATVGDRKREMIQKQADELGIRVLNRREEG